jgi:hypothetical protein
MRPKQIDVHRRCRRHAAAVAAHLVHHHGRFGNTEARAAMLLGHGDAEPAVVGHSAMKFFGKLPVFVARKPVFVVETGDDGANTLSDGVEMGLATAIDGIVRIHRRLLTDIKATRARTSNASCNPGCMDGLRRRV